MCAAYRKISLTILVVDHMNKTSDKLLLLNEILVIFELRWLIFLIDEQSREELKKLKVQFDKQNLS